MKVLELFAGTRSIGKAFEARGHEVFSVEWDRKFKDIDLYEDIGKLSAEDILSAFGRPDVIWASPDCTTYSVMAISHHRRKSENGELDPVSDYAKFCDEVNAHVIQLIKQLGPKYYFIENPRGGLRTMNFMKGLPRYTVTYCQYGEARMKPTDIWTNHPSPNFRPPCKNGDRCHSPAPRWKNVRRARDEGIDVSMIGGTQYGYDKGDISRDRSVIPKELCDHIVDICEGIDPTEGQVSMWEMRLTL